jgi:peptidoglycan/LPS O-acetylase OafA/YrhL
MSGSAAPADPAAREHHFARSYFRELDGVRAISILAVLTWHATDRLARLHGHHGVTFFFVLSGFLITTLLLREEAAHGGVNLRAFWVRRIFRIVPLYYCALALYVATILVLGLQPERAAEFRTALPYYLFYFQEYPAVFLPCCAPFHLSWSLGIEEKFYLVWPAAAFAGLLAARVRLGGLLLAAILILLLPVSWLWSGLVYPYLPIVMGCLLAVLLNDRRAFAAISPIGRAAGPLLVVALASFMLGASLAALTAISACCTLALAALVSAPAGSTAARLMGSAPAVFVGRRSYGIYLLHQLVLNVTRKVLPADTSLGRALLVIAVGACASLAVAAVAHVLVERPLIDLGRRLASRVGPPSRLPDLSPTPSR